jgi:hypothetical protein
MNANQYSSMLHSIQGCVSTLLRIFFCIEILCFEVTYFEVIEDIFSWHVFFIQFVYVTRRLLVDSAVY